MGKRRKKDSFATFGVYTRSAFDIKVELLIRVLISGMSVKGGFGQAGACPLEFASGGIADTCAVYAA